MKEGVLVTRQFTTHKSTKHLWWKVLSIKTVVEMFPPEVYVYLLLWKSFCCLYFPSEFIRIPSNSQHEYEKFTALDPERHYLTLTVKDDDPAVSTTRLGVVAEANVVTLHAGRLAVVTQVHFVATETGISWLHTSKLQNTKGVMQIITSAIQNKLWVTLPIMLFIKNPFGMGVSEENTKEQTLQGKMWLFSLL